MTPDELSTRRTASQRVVDALADLFDGVAPSDRAAAEEELREAGVDPDRVARRIADTATGALAGSTAHAAQQSRRSGTAHAAGPGRRAASEPIGERVLGRPRAGRALARAVAVLLVGIAIGWLLPRGTAPPTPDAEVARGARHPSASEQWSGAAGTDATDRPRSAQRPPPVADSGSVVASGRPRHEERSRAQVGAESTPGTEEPQGPATEAAPGVAPDAAPEVSPLEQQPDAGGGEEETASTLERSRPWILDQSNWTKAKDLLPAPVLQHVKTGEYWYTVEPMATERFRGNYSPDFWAKSQANAGRYDVDPSTCGLREVAGGRTPSFYFGFPFPEIAQDDPAAGCEVMWNADAAGAIDGGQEALLALDQLAAGTAPLPPRLPVRLHSAAFQGRQSGPIRNPDNLRSATLVQVSAPSELAGTAFLTFRPNDAASRDRTWTYIPALRRVRAVSPANRSDSFLGSDLSLDELQCFDGKLEDFDWRVVGRQTVLAPVTSLRPIRRTSLSPARAEIAVPSPRAAFEVEGATGAPWLVVENLVMVPRPVWVVEGVPRDQYYRYGKLVLYVDRELYRTYWRLAYTWQGAYAAHTMCAQHWSRSADGALASATASTLTSVNDTLRRATLTRYNSQILDQELGAEFFSIARVIELAR